MGATTSEACVGISMDYRFSRKENAIGSDRSFGLVFAVIFMAIGFYPLVSNGGEVQIWAIWISFMFGTAALFFPKVLNRANIFWTKFGIVLGKVVAPVVMFTIFIGIVIPTGLLLRMMAIDLLRLKFKTKDTYWRNRVDKSSMKDQF